MRRLGRFSEADLEEIQAAVTAAERRTSGEIVTYIVGESDSYPEVDWMAACAGLVVGLGAGLGVFLTRSGWVSSALEWWVLPPLVGTLLGVAAVQFDPVRRRLLRASTVQRRVGLRAEAAFLEEEVFATRERTGILIFLSLLEHRAILLADSGIHSRVGTTAWESIVADLTVGLRAGRRAEPLIQAIDRCGELLERHGVELRQDDSDELSNRPRLRPR